MRKVLQVTAVAFAMAITSMGAPAQAAPADGNGFAGSAVKGSPKTVATAGVHAKKPEVVKDSYIVVLRDDVVSSVAVADKAAEIAKKFNGKVGHKYTKALRGFEITLNEKAAKRLVGDPAVESVEPNQVVRLDATQTPVPSWGLDRVDQRNLPLNNSYTYPTTASNVHAYIVDTGIRTTHTDFGGRAVWGTNTTGDGNNTDCNGHGTHVAGTTGGGSFGVAKGVSLTAVKVLDCAGSGTTAGVVAGVDWVTANAIKPAVANMSLGGGVQAALDTAVANSIASGVTYAIAAGNSNGADACNFSPARVPAAITVGATDIADNRASFSNIGTCLDIFGPGVNITSAWNTNDTATNTISGTSMATPHTAGVAALVLSQNPAFTPQQVRDSLVNSATNNVVLNPGAGSPNKLLFVENGGAPPVNDFSLSVSPTSATVLQGGAVNTTVSTATTSGSPQTVTFSASGLPAGATASFNPGSVTSGGSSTLTIQTSGSTPVGTYVITVSGTAASGTRSAPFTLTVQSVGGCQGAGQKLLNPGFESGQANWATTPGVIGQWAPYEPPRTGTWNAWHLGYGVSNYDISQQTVTLPANCTSYLLKFWLHIDTAEFEGIAFDGIRVQAIVGSTTTNLALWTNLDAAPGYTQRTVDLSQFKGQTILLRFYATEDWSLQTSFVIDDTSLNVS